MKAPQFELGQTVLVATFQANKQVFIECPECNGDKYVTVLAGRNEPVTVACENCKVHGFGEFSRGTVTQHVPQAEVQLTTIIGIEIRQDGQIEYRTKHGIYTEERIFSTEMPELCNAWAENMAAQFTRDEAERHTRKHRHDKTWAWNASYHRKAIKEANRQLEYHTKSLDVAARLSRLNTLTPSKAKTDENNIA